MTLMSCYVTNVSFRSQENCGRRYDVMASALDSGSIGPGLSPGWVIALYSWITQFTLTVLISTDQCV